MSWVASVDIKGWIFKRAEKTPAKALNSTHKETEIKSAMITRIAIGIATKFQGPMLKKVTMFIPGCRISPVTTEPRATIRPTLKSVPARRIRPATPSA